MGTLSAKLFVRPYYKQRDDLELLVEFTNDADQPIYISNNIAVAFVRGEAQSLTNTSKVKKQNKTSYYKIPPRKSVIKRANLGKSFAGAAGIYELLFKLSALKPHYKKGADKVTITGLGVKSTKIKVQIGNPVKGKLNVTFLKKGTGSNLLEAPTAAGFLQPLLEAMEELPPGVEPAQPCEVNGGTPQQQNAARMAHEKAYAIAVNSLAKLRKDGTYRHWFGSYTPRRFYKVRDTLRQVIQDFQDKIFTYNVDTNTGGDVIANAEFGNLTIQLFKGFFHLLSGGHGGKASRVFHEHTHASGNTFDHAYDENECLNLASNKPDDAVENANSFRFFADA